MSERRRRRTDRPRVDAGHYGQIQDSHHLNQLSKTWSRRSMSDAPVTPSHPCCGILIMGLTGAGKSTFISHLTHGNIDIGHSLESCTAAVELSEYRRSDGQVIVLIDTPGFDDSSKDNARVLEEVVRTLNQYHDEGSLQLIGILYFQRISDVRMSGSSLKTLRIFEKLCGSECFHRIVVVTTFWGIFQNDRIEVGEERELALQNDRSFFGTLLEGGATMMRFRDTRRSACEIIDRMTQYQEVVVLSVQKEMVDEGLSLAASAVGQFLAGDLSAMRHKYERTLRELQSEYEDALADQNEQDLATALLEQQRGLQDGILHSQSAEESLYVTYEKMTQDKQERALYGAQDESSKTEDSDVKTARELELEEQLEQAEKDHIRQMNLLRRDKEAELREGAEVTENYEQKLVALREALTIEKAKRKKSRTKARAQTMWPSKTAIIDSAKYLSGQLGPPRRAESYPTDSKQSTKRHHKKSAWTKLMIRRPRKPRAGVDEYPSENDNSDEEEDSDSNSTAAESSVSRSALQWPEGTTVSNFEEPSRAGPPRVPEPPHILESHWALPRSYTLQDL